MLRGKLWPQLGVVNWLSSPCWVFDVVDAETPLPSDGVPVPVELLQPGENARLPFTGTAGQYVSALVNVTSGSFGCWALEVWSVATNSRVGPANTTCASGTGSRLMEPVTLPLDGNYYVLINPNLHNTGGRKCSSL
jgi:hypothetical protein